MATPEDHASNETQAAADTFRPRAPRTVATLLSAKLELGPGKEALCRLRNVSATGMLVETGQALAPEDPVVIELRSGERLSATVVWSRDGRVGIRLDREIDVASALRPPAIKGEAQPVGRAPRFAVAAAGRVSSLGRSGAVTIENISQSGALLSLSGDIPLGAPVTLTINGLAPRGCTVRWRADRHVGVAFIELISFADLSAWLARPTSER